MARPERGLRLCAALWIALLLTGAAGSALAVDGAIEINAASALQGGVTATDAPGLPVTIGAPGSYRLTGDLDTSIGSGAAEENTTVVEITADDVTLDLNGFAIQGPGLTGLGDGVRSTAQNTVVQNGTVDGVGRDGLSLGLNARVHDCTVVNVGRDGVSTGASSLVEGCTIRDSGGFGLLLGAGSGFGGNVLAGNNGGNEQAQVAGRAFDIHEVGVNVCGNDTTCAGPPDRLVFVSSQFYDGNLGGIPGANATCNALASSAGLSGTFAAWVAHAVTSPLTSFVKTPGRWVLRSGAEVAYNWDDLTDGTLANPIDEDENGAPVPASVVWTNVATSGAFRGFMAPDHCTGWTSFLIQDTGRVGNTSFSDARWTDDGTQSCAALAVRLYCFEQ